MLHMRLNVIKLVWCTLTDSWLNSNISTQQYTTFHNLGCDTRMERPLLFFLAPLIYFFWYFVVSWGFVLLHQHKKLHGCHTRFLSSNLVFQTTRPLWFHDHISYSIIHCGRHRSLLLVMVVILNLCFHLVACCFLISHLPLVLHWGHALALHLSGCCCLSVFRSLSPCPTVLYNMNQEFHPQLLSESNGSCCLLLLLAWFNLWMSPSISIYWYMRNSFLVLSRLGGLIVPKHSLLW